MEAKLADAFLEGGGVRGIALAGAISVAEEMGYRWVNIAGVSAGAIVAPLSKIKELGEKTDKIKQEMDTRLKKLEKTP